MNSNIKLVMTYCVRKSSIMGRCFVVLMLFLLGGVFSIGCSSALPSQSSDEVTSIALRKAEDLARRATMAAEEARQERQRSEELVRESQRMLESAEMAKSSCQAALREARKPRPCIIRRPKTPAVESTTVTATPVVSTTTTTIPIIDYAPSDAPVEPIKK